MVGKAEEGWDAIGCSISFDHAFRQLLLWPASHLLAGRVCAACPEDFHTCLNDTYGTHCRGDNKYLDLFGHFLLALLPLQGVVLFVSSSSSRNQNDIAL